MPAEESGATAPAQPDPGLTEHDQSTELPQIDPLRSQLESVLLVVDQPVTTAALAQALGVGHRDIDKQLISLSRELDQRGSGFELASTAEGFRLLSRRANAEAVEAFLTGGSQTKLSRAALETLAVVAYRQPCTRAQVAGVRGVSVDGVMRTLELRGLIRQIEPDEHTGAHRFETTELFLELLGIDSLEALPDLAPLLPNLDDIDELDLPDEG
ncbi:SMC-Scp complex subunit ScpB [Corynebacterium atypicum]|uniref:SMC-Scp complex subunit ScpB n=1 Tax=Corynebacterium atypicum TaxID=191610 RepID=UPI000A013F84|nr:SMC-Scp complex subunit ScpB [Corynebacterium atypicum]